MQEPLKSLFDYTTFHIGIYVSLGAAIIAAGIFREARKPLLMIALLALGVAGASGAVIASNLPGFEVDKSSGKSPHTQFVEKKATVFDTDVFEKTYGELIEIEHIAFWTCIVILVGGYACGLFEKPSENENLRLHSQLVQSRDMVAVLLGLTFVVIALQWKVWITALVITPLVLSATCFWAVNERILAGNEETRLDFMNANFVGAAQHSHLWYAAWLLIAVAVGMAGILLVSGNLP